MCVCTCVCVCVYVCVCVCGGGGGGGGGGGNMLQSLLCTNTGVVRVGLLVYTTGDVSLCCTPSLSCGMG